jgi:1,4-dihydroxy-2-naphthoyl-CoA hydrolase
MSEGAAVQVDPETVAAHHRGCFPELLGMRWLTTSRDRVVAELTIRPDLMTTGGRLHGGVLMALADTVGATAAFLNLPPASFTTTLESKTNFFAPGIGGAVRAEATPLHRGGRTSVWQTRITDESGRLLSLTTQTQMILPK